MENNIDIESFRRSRTEKLRVRLNDAVSFFSHRGWEETNARVEDCSRLRGNPNNFKPWTAPATGGYAVGLSYDVDGKHYEAGAISPVEVEKGVTIRIRYNPRNPKQNNSFSSETSWVPFAVRIETILLVFLMLGLLAAGIMVRR